RFSNKASLHRKQALFAVQTSLVCNAKKPCLQCILEMTENEGKTDAVFGNYLVNLHHARER
uniref:hypothetical protein n=1 Tax=Prevotella sp. TaxID=59823 RepID=UPI003FF05FFC